MGILSCHLSPAGFIGCSETYTGWQIAMQIDGAAWQTLGYYTNAAFGSGPLASGATQYQVGSEVANTAGNGSVVNGSPAVTMGEHPLTTPNIVTAPYGFYSYVRNYSIIGSNGTPASAPDGLVGVGTQHETCETFGTCTYNFTAEGFGTPGASSWSNWYWYGDNEVLIW